MKLMIERATKNMLVATDALSGEFNCNKPKSNRSEKYYKTKMGKHQSW